MDWQNRPEVKEAEERAKRVTVSDNIRKAKAEIRVLNNGYFTRKGKDATKVLTEGSVAYEDLRKKYTEDLADPELQEMFTRQFDQYTHAQLGRLSSHQINSTNQYEADVRKGHDEEAVDQGIVYWKDEMEHVKHLGQAVSNVQQLYKGSDEKFIDSEIAKAKTFYSERVIAGVRKRHGPEAGLQVLETLSPNVDPERIGDIRKSLQTEAKVKDLDQRVHDKSLEIHNSGKSPEEKAAWIDSLPAEMTDRVGSKVNSFELRQKKINTEKLRETLADYNGLFEESGESLTVELARESISHSGLSTAQQRAFLRPWEKVINARLTAEGKQHAENASVALYSQISRLIPTNGSMKFPGTNIKVKFSDLPLEKLYPVLGKERYEKLRTAQQGTNKGKAATPLDTTLKAFDTMFPDKDVKGDPDAALRLANARVMAEQRMEEYISGGHSPSEVQKYANSILLQAEGEVGAGVSTPKLSDDARERLEEFSGVPVEAYQMGSTYITSTAKAESSVDKVIKDNGIILTAQGPKGLVELEVRAVTQDGTGAVREVYLEDGRVVTPAELAKGIPYVKYRKRTDKERRAAALKTYKELRKELPEPTNALERRWGQYVDSIYEGMLDA